MSATRGRRSPLARFAVVIAFALVVSTCATSPTSPPFDPDRALAHVRWLADPARQGRLSGSPSFFDAATYVSDRFREIGLEPLGDDGTFLQRFTHPIMSLEAMPTLERVTPSAKTYRARIDFSPYVSGRAGGGAAGGTIVAVGAGERADYTGIDAAGQIALVSGGGRGNPIEVAFQQQATAVLVVVEHPEIRPSFLPFIEPTTIPALQISRTVAEDLLGRSLDGGRGDTGVRAKIEVPLGTVRQVESANVVGLLRGRDAAASQRAVMVGGHLDGLGTDPDGVVFPGANDNASGAAIVIEAARALSSIRERMSSSIVFVAFGGEEEGYLGSSAYVARVAALPGRPESLIAFLDVDASGCCGNALGASADDADLQARVRSAVVARGIPVTTPTGGSDHQVFSRAHVRSVLIQWTDVYLHQPGDDASIVDRAHLLGAGAVVTSVAAELATGR